MRRSAAVLGTLLGGSLLLAAANDAFGHAHMTAPIRRANCQSGDDATCKGLGPCGGTPNPQITPAVFNVGSSYTLTWTETIEHVSTFQMNMSTSGGATQAAFYPVMPENAVPDQVGAGPHLYTWQWTVPNYLDCNPCVFQLIQDMDATVGTIGNPYYNCADIRILPAGQVPTPIPETPTPTPTPDNSNPDGAVSVDGYGSCTVGGFGSRAVAHGAWILALGVGLAAFVRRRSR